jgi:NADH dehydrogenase
MGEDEYVPPRAQSAHQMDTCAYRNIVATVSGKDLEDFRYKDFGSLISLGEFSTIGNLMGNLMSGTVFVEGWLARMFYLSLYRMHQASIYGYVATGLRMIADALYRATHSKIKLH